MGKALAWLIEGLERQHNRDAFNCNEPALNDFIRRQARQQQRKHLSRTFVAVLPNDTTRRVLGFYTLSAGSISFHSLPEETRKKLPRYPVPVARLGRLAVDRSQHGKGLGSVLLRHALLRAAKVAQTGLGVIAVVVDAKNDDAITFYQHYGFVQFQDSPNSLFLPVKTILTAIQS